MLARWRLRERADREPFGQRRAAHQQRVEIAALALHELPASARAADCRRSAPCGSGTCPTAHRRERDRDRPRRCRPRDDARRPQRDGGARDQRGQLERQRAVDRTGRPSAASRDAPRPDARRRAVQLLRRGLEHLARGSTGLAVELHRADRVEQDEGVERGRRRAACGASARAQAASARCAGSGRLEQARRLDLQPAPQRRRCRRHRREPLTRRRDVRGDPVRRLGPFDCRSDRRRVCGHGGTR